MKALVAVALVVTSMPLLAAPAAGKVAKAAKKYCEQVPMRTGSRVVRRICMTRAQWAEKLGPDWRERLAGTDVEADMAALDSMAKDYEAPVAFKPKSPM